jgi:hypothetical protein
MMMSPIDIVESSSVKEMGWLEVPEAIADVASKGWVAPGSLNVSSTWIPSPDRRSGEGGVAICITGEGQPTDPALGVAVGMGGVPNGSWKMTPSWAPFHEGDRMGIELFLFDRRGVIGPLVANIPDDMVDGDEGDGRGAALDEDSAGNLNELIASVCVGVPAVLGVRGWLGRAKRVRPYEALYKTRRLPRREGTIGEAVAIDARREGSKAIVSSGTGNLLAVDASEWRRKPVLSSSPASAASGPSCKCEQVSIISPSWKDGRARSLYGMARWASAPRFRVLTMETGIPFLCLLEEIKGAKRAAIGSGGLDEYWPAAGD